MSTYSSNSPRVNRGAARGTVVQSFSETGHDMKKKSKMGFFKRKFMEWAKRAWEDSHEYSHGVPVAVKSDSHRIDVEPQLNFKIYGATGGHIMEFGRYDRKSDRYDNQLYIISTDDDIGERVARIVNMEMMK
jgi:hypothetical protein